MTSKEREKWFERYYKCFEEETGLSESEIRDIDTSGIAQSSYRKGYAPERAARQDARFMMTGE